MIYALRNGFGKSLLQLKTHPKTIRPVFGWLNIVFNQVDHERLKLVGPDRTCTEWVLRNGGSVKWVGIEKWATNYNTLPSENTKVLVEKIDGTSSSISHYGFLHLRGCRHINEIILNDCSYIENEALKQLGFVQNTLTRLHISAIGNITAEGILHLKKLSNLKSLELFNLSYVKQQKTVLEELKAALPNCDIKSDFDK